MAKRTIRIPPQFGGRDSEIDRLSYDAQTVHRNDDIWIDLRHLSFMRPPGVIGLLTLIEKLVQRGCSVSIRLPVDDEVLSYLAQTHIKDALSQIAEVQGDRQVLETSAPRLTTLVPISWFSTSREVEHIANQIEETFGRPEHGLASLLNSCYLVATELAINAVEHSGRSRGWILAQKYIYEDGPIVEVAVGDSGIGIRASLRKNPKFALLPSDRDALKLAIRPGVSRYREPTRGYGLDHVRQEIRHRARRLTLRSGTGCLVVYDDGSIESSERAPIVDVLAHARIPC